MFSHIKEFFTRPSGYNISRSVRLRSSATGYFNRTPSSTTNQQKWTFSTWMKLGGAITGNTAIFVAGTTGSNFCSLAIDGNNNVSIFWYVGASTIANVATSAKLRDPSAWYHLVVIVDTTQATSANRVIVYLNGVQQTSYASTTYPSQNYNGLINSNIAHYIGQYGTAGYNNFDGYLTEVNFIDGQALTPSSFGETDAITGVWKPKKYAGTYGTNGFYLNLSDNSNNTASTIGKDYSGNGNNWTPTNISVTAGSTYDSMTDVPTLTSATAGNYCVMNPLGNAPLSGITFSNGNLTVTASSTRQHMIATMAIPTTGKWYWEVSRGNTASASSSYQTTGIALLNAAISSSPSTWRPSNVWGYDNSGYKVENGSFTGGYTGSGSTSDIMGMAFDSDAGTLAVYLNNTLLFTISSLTSQYVPYIGIESPAAPNANFGQRPFSYTPPTGYVALNTFNLPDSTIKNGAGYMAATTYTGNGTSSGRSVSNTVNGVSFQPDFVWNKSRTSGALSGSHMLYDSVRGVGKRLISNATNAEDSNSIYGYLSSFDSTGYSSSAGSTDNENLNENSIAYVSWMWKAGGTSSSNTNGSITSTVSAGATQGFSVVTYTGNGSSSATVGHGLGVAPSMIIVKARSGGSDWEVFHTSLGASYGIRLDTTAAKIAASSTAGGIINTSPTSTTFGFTAGTSNVNNVNENGVTWVAYCFAAVKGFSAFGSYTGNGSSDGPFVYTGFRPRFVIIKNSTTAGTDWDMYDSSRSTYNQANAVLRADTSGAELSILPVDFLSNGFKIRDTGTDINTSSATMIYMAFAENPFKNSLAR